MSDENAKDSPKAEPPGGISSVERSERLADFDLRGISGRPAERHQP